MERQVKVMVCALSDDADKAGKKEEKVN